MHSTIIGIDAHSRKNVATAIVVETGEIRQIELRAEPDLLIDWIESEGFPTPIMAVTGFYYLISRYYDLDAPDLTALSN